MDYKTIMTNLTDVKKTSAPTEVPQEIIQTNYITESEVVANG